MPNSNGLNNDETDFNPIKRIVVLISTLICVNSGHKKLTTLHKKDSQFHFYGGEESRTPVQSHVPVHSYVRFLRI